jgi:putative membrane protein
MSIHDEQEATRATPVKPSRFWLWLSLLIAGLAVLEAIVVRIFHLDEGQLGSYLGVLILGIGLIALVTGIATHTGWARALVAAALVIVIGGTAEIVGLYSGLLFGRYEYTHWWLPYVTLPNGKLFPLLLPITWFLVVATCYLLLARRLRRWALILGTAALAAALDIALEPIITRVVLFWRWLEPGPLLGAPYRNALGWFAISGLAAGCLEALQLWRARELSHPAWMFPVGIFSTTVVGLTYGEPAGVAALALLPVSLWVRRRV